MGNCPTSGSVTALTEGDLGTRCVDAVDQTKFRALDVDENPDRRTLLAGRVHHSPDIFGGEVRAVDPGDRNPGGMQSGNFVFARRPESCNDFGLAHASIMTDGSVRDAPGQIKNV